MCLKPFSTPHLSHTWASTHTQNKCVMRAFSGPRGLPYWFSCCASKHTNVERFCIPTCTQRHTDVSHWYLSLSPSHASCCCTEIKRFTAAIPLLHSALSTIPLTLNKAAGHCAEAPPSSHRNPYQQIFACSAKAESNCDQFSVYRATAINTINPFTQQQHYVLFQLLHCDFILWELLGVVPCFVDVLLCKCYN